MTDTNVYKLLSTLQRTLKVPKGQENKFGGYKYRSCEDILEELKKHLPDDAILVLQDDIELISDRVYVKASAELWYGGACIKTKAYAREPLEKKGSDASQITGAASSYARKYALNGLFLIDDTKDADATNDHDKGPKEYVSSVADGNHRSGNKAIDKLVNDSIRIIANAVNLEDLKISYKTCYRDCEQSGAHVDQLALLEQQKDTKKEALAAKGEA